MILSAAASDRKGLTLTTFDIDGSPVKDATPLTDAVFAEDVAVDPDLATATVEEPSSDLAVAEQEPGTDIDLAEDDPDADWKHDFLEFKGDRLGIRKPTQQALAGFSLASSKYVSMETKNDITGLFIANHLSPASYGRVFSRLMNPDDDEYTVETIGDLMRAIVLTATSSKAE